MLRSYLCNVVICAEMEFCFSAESSVNLLWMQLF